MFTNWKYLLTLGLLAIVMLASIGPTAKPAEDAEVPKKLKPILQAYDIILSEYLKSEEIDTQKLVKQAISGMLESLDSKYSKISTQTEFKNYWKSLNRSYVGIGKEIEMLDGQPTVLSLFPQTPAQRSPIRPGDKIKRISNNPTEGMSLEDIYEALDGERETKVGLKKESFKTFGNSFPDFPIAVLINDRTASAAELFAAVIRDRKVGVLVGRNSRGKSVVQHYFQLSNDFWLKLTTSQSLTPSGYKIPNTA